MGVAEIWTGDDIYYRFLDSTSMDPNQGEIIKEISEYRKGTHQPTTNFTNNISSESINESLTTSSELNNNTNSQSQINDDTVLKYEPLNTDLHEQYTPHLKYTFMVSSLCNNSSVTMDDETKEWVAVGDPTEVALTVASQRGKLDKLYWEQHEKMIKVHERAFDSERKLMSVIYKQGATNSSSFNDLPSSSSSSSPSVPKKINQKEQVEDDLIDYWVLCKGAPEKVLAKCNTYLTPSTSSTDNKSLLTTFSSMNDNYLEQILKQSSSMASQGLRVLGLAFKKIKVSSKQIEKEGIDKITSLAENEFGFVALTGLMDPPKNGVQEAVTTCQEAGIRVMMITGDHIDTATAIAEKLGIFKKNVHGLVS